MNGYREENDHCYSYEARAQLSRPSAEKDGDCGSCGGNRQQQQAGKQPLMVDVRKDSVLTASADQQIVRLKSVAPHGDQEQECGKDRQMPADVCAHPQACLLPSEPGRERIENHDKHRYRHDEKRRPRIERLLEWEPRGVEPEIVLEVWIC